MFWALLGCLAAHFGSPNAIANSFVRMDYNLFTTSRARGTIFIELFDDRPITRDNFLTYVNNGAYDTTLMHRMVRNFVIQGGGFEGDEGVYVDGPPFPYIFPIPTDQDGNPNTANPTIVNEFGNSPPRSNVKGTLAMAKVGPPDGQDPTPETINSATSQFFFNLNNNGGTAPGGLDFQNGGFTVFAQVVGDGMNLMDAYNNGLNILNLNPDTNGNGIRDTGQNGDSGPFGSLPALGSSAQNYAPLVLLNADQIDYLGAGLTTAVPAGGLTFATRDTFIDTGTLFTGTGALTVGVGRTLGVREGTTLASRSLINRGTLEPGLRIGSITVQSFRQDPGASLQIEINGTTADTLYDRLVVTGGALLGGDLDVTLFNYTPVVGNSFTILTAALISGNFDNINLPLLSPGFVWNISKTNTALTLSVATGDYNRDGIVDAADYVLWRKTRNTTTGTAYAGADGNGDSMINDLDLAIWRTNFGSTRGGSFGGGAASMNSFAAPEPSSALLLLIAGLPFVLRRGRVVSRRWQSA